MLILFYLFTILLFDGNLMCCSFYMFYGENVISLFLRIAWNIVERLAFSE